MRLEKRTDPACPKCGCPDCPKIAGKGRTLKWGAQYKDGKVLDDAVQPPLAPSRRCQHCATVFRAQDPAADVDDDGEVLFERLRCPHCGGTDHTVTRTMPGGEVRYHRCACGLTFKSRSV